MAFLRIAAGLVALGAILMTFCPDPWSIAGAEQPACGAPAPGFTAAGRWYNSPPLTQESLRGKVVLVEFWARECINCIHVLPHTKALHDTYAKDGLVVIGVHTPEYDQERDPVALQAALQRLQITWPIAVDNEHRIWNAYGNQFWPAIYLIDRNGRLVYRQVGEGNYRATEQRVRALLGKA